MNTTITFSSMSESESAETLVKGCKYDIWVTQGMLDAFGDICGVSEEEIFKALDKALGDLIDNSPVSVEYRKEKRQRDDEYWGRSERV